MLLFFMGSPVAARSDMEKNWSCGKVDGVAVWWWWRRLSKQTVADNVVLCFCCPVLYWPSSAILFLCRPFISAVQLLKPLTVQFRIAARILQRPFLFLFFTSAHNNNNIRRLVLTSSFIVTIVTRCNNSKKNKKIIIITRHSGMVRRNWLFLNRFCGDRYGEKFSKRKRAVLYTFRIQTIWNIRIFMYSRV